MNNAEDHQTTAFMNTNGGSYPGVTPAGDATSGGRLLTNVGEANHPRVRMTKPARTRVRIAIIVMVIVIIVIVVALIAALTSTSSKTNTPTFEAKDQSAPREVPHEHVRCNHDVIMAKEGLHSHWLNYDSNTHTWKSLPNVENTGYVLISPKYRLEAGYPGIQVSMLLPRNNTRYHVMAVTPSFHHTHPVTLVPGKYQCESVAIDDQKLFNGDEIVFRIYVYYKSHVRLDGIKFTVTSLPLAVRFKPLSIHSTKTTQPKFSHINAGERDVCSVEIENSQRQCNWWNVGDGDSADFTPVESHDCISSGVITSKDATWFFAVESHDVHHESRALLISPVIERSTPSVLLTMWFIFKCEGPHVRIHLIPAGENALRRSVASSSAVAEITSPASHDDWKFMSFQIILPPEHDAYHIVLEGIVISNGNCSRYYCSVDGLGFGVKQASSPMLGLDSITIEHMHEQCENTTGTSVVDCDFQTDTGDPTICGWISSKPPSSPDFVIPGYENFFNDWKAVNSGADSEHGATAQHFEGRGYIMSFDASGRATSQSYFRTPMLIAKNNCSCVMELQYLMRGRLIPRLQVNMIYGEDIDDDARDLEPQWSLLGHQSEDWKVATISINLKKNSPFQIEVRVLDINAGRGDVHFDDVHFIGCDMDKYTSS